MKSPAKFAAALKIAKTHTGPARERALYAVARYVTTEAQFCELHAEIAGAKAVAS